MWREIRWAVVTAALLAGAPAAVGAQSDTNAGAPGNTAQMSPGGGAAGANAVPTESAEPGRDRPPASGGSLMPCSTKPPYMSLPCQPAKR